MSDFWHQLGTALGEITRRYPPPQWPLLLGLALVFAALICWSPAWRVVRHADTIFHEGGHAFMSFLFREERQRIYLHPDSSGRMAAMGREARRWYSGAVISAAGYTAGSALGLLMALSISFGYAAATLWALLLILLAILVHVRTFWGWLTVLLALALTVISVWFLPAPLTTALATALAMGLNLSSLRAAIEQLQLWRQGPASTQRLDAQNFARHTHVPVVVACWVFILFDCLCLGGQGAFYAIAPAHAAGA